MAGKFTSGERRGLVGLLMMMCIFIVMAWATRHCRGIAPAPVTDSVAAVAAPVKPNIDSAVYVPVAKSSKRRTKSASRASGKPAAPVKPPRDILGEQNN